MILLHSDIILSVLIISSTSVIYTPMQMKISQTNKTTEYKEVNDCHT